MGKQIRSIHLIDQQRSELEQVIHKRTSPQQMVLRSQIIVMTAQGLAVDEIMKRLGTSKLTIRKWKKRFIDEGLAGLSDKPRPGKPIKYGSEIRHKIAAAAV